MEINVEADIEPYEDNNNGEEFRYDRKEKKDASITLAFTPPRI